MQSYLIGALVFMITLVVFVFQNQQTVKIQFITWVSPEISLALVVLLAACSGALITFLVDSFRHFKTLQKLREENIKGKKLKKAPGKVKGSTDI